MSKFLVRVGKDASEMSKSLGEYVAEHSAAAVAARGRFSIAFSGGSLPKLACADITNNSTIAWDKWDIFLVDERCVPLDHADSNFKAIKENLIDKLSGSPILSSSVATYDPTSSSPEEAACRYTSIVLERVPPASGGAAPSFDLVLLGMGEDGHTASLFPGHALLGETTKMVAHILDSPKPPPERITFTYPLIKAAKAVAVVAAGAGKAGLLSEILGPKGCSGEAYPVQRTCDAQGDLRWFIDEAAASSLDKAALTSF